MKREEKGFASKGMPSRRKNTMILQHIPKDQDLCVVPPAQHQHIPKFTNLFKVSRTLSIRHRVRFFQFSLYLCHYCPPHEYANLLSEAVQTSGCSKNVVVWKSLRFNTSQNLPVGATTGSPRSTVPACVPQCSGHMIHKVQKKGPLWGLCNQVPS